MAIYYIDPVNGDNANDGTTYALRKKTTLPTMAAGDTLRVVSSSALSLGNATWVHDGGITFNGELTRDIYKDGAWTAGTNVTASLPTTLEREGSNNVGLTFAAGFTTGKAGYYATGTLDLSNYTKVSFWFRSSLAVADASLVYTLTLCSDTAGATPVDTFAFPAIALVREVWTPMTIARNGGGALGNSIASVALNAIADPGVPIVYLDNIFATNDLSLNTLVSKNSDTAPSHTIDDELWWPLRSIVVTSASSTGIFEYEGVNGTTTTPTGYTGANATVETFALTPMPVPSSATQNTSFWAPGNAGTSVSPITISGGWTAASSMTAQSGGSWMTPQNGSQYLFWAAAAADYWNVERCGWDFGYRAFGRATGALDHVLTKVYGTRQTESTFYSASLAGLTMTDCVAIAGSLEGFQLDLVYGLTMTGCFAACCASHGCAITGKLLIMKDCDFYDGRTYGGIALNINGSMERVNTGRGKMGFRFNSSIIDATDLTVVQCTSYSLAFFDSSVLDCRNLTTSGPAVGIDMDVEGVGESYKGSIVRVHNWSYSEATPVDFEDHAGGIVISTRDDGVEDAYIIRQDFGTITAQTGTRHTAPGYAWQISPTSTSITSTYPLQHTVGHIFCEDGVAVTISVWCRINNAAIAGRLRIKANSLGGVGTSDLTTTVAPSVDTWTQYSIGFTPTETGFVELIIEAYGGTTHSLFWDDLTISPAATLDASSGDYGFYKTGVMLQSGNGTGSSGSQVAYTFAT